MFENALSIRRVSLRGKIALKTVVSLGLIALAVVFPQLAHLALGQVGGAKWLPMYLPVLIGGCLLGSGWSLAVGVLAPLTSFLITSAASGAAMPAASRLPFMMAELAVFALVSGLFTKKINENGAWAFVAVISAQLAGRGVFIALAAAFSSTLSASAAWAQVQTGLSGLIAQAIAVPAIIIALRAILIREKND